MICRWEIMMGQLQRHWVRYEQSDEHWGARGEKRWCQVAGDTWRKEEIKENKPKSQQQTSLAAKISGEDLHVHSDICRQIGLFVQIWSIFLSKTSIWYCTLHRMTKGYINVAIKGFSINIIMMHQCKMH